MASAMTLKDLNEHIHKTAIEVLKGEFGTTLTDTIAKSIDEALKPVKGDVGKAQAEQQELRDQLKSMAQEKSPLSTPQKTREKGEAMGACVRACFKAKNDPVRAAKFLEQEGNGDLGEMLKSMHANDPEVGGILIPEVVSAEVIDLLRDAVVVRAMGAQALTIGANYSMPKKTQSTSSYYVGEGQAGTTSSLKTGSVKLTPKKLVTVVPASNDLFKYTSPGADAIIRNDIMDSMRVREDQAFLRDTGTDANGTATSPKGIRQWAKEAGNNLAVTASFDLDKVTSDLGTLILKLIEGKVPMMRPGWIMSPRTWNYLMTIRTTNGPYAFRDEMSRGTLWGWPFRYTTSIPTTLTVGALTGRSELYLVDFADVVIGDSQSIMIDASGEAAYEEGGSVKSAFHRDETVIRAIVQHDLVVRRSESVAYFEDVNWAA